MSTLGPNAALTNSQAPNGPSASGIQPTAVRRERSSIFANPGAPSFMNECTFDYLHMEFIHHCIRHSMIMEPTESYSHHARKTCSIIDGVGYNVGVRLSERLTKETAWYNEQLDIIKYVCKEIWSVVFKKQIDKLQTNYKGVYVLHDSALRSITRITPLSSTATQDQPAATGSNTPVTATDISVTNVGSDSLADEYKLMSSFACGVIRGCLHNLGMSCTVKCEITKPPAAQFTITDVEKNKKTPPQSGATANVSANPSANLPANPPSSTIASNSASTIIPAVAMENGSTEIITSAPAT